MLYSRHIMRSLNVAQWTNQGITVANKVASLKVLNGINRSV